MTLELGRARNLLDRVGPIAPRRDPQGRIETYTAAERSPKFGILSLVAYGAGPFCRFSPAQGLRARGLYAVTENEPVFYVGICEDLARRWGPMGYGGISPRNCHVGGQPTYVRVNHLVLCRAKAGAQLDLWFLHYPDLPTPELRMLEREFINELEPPWNLEGRRGRVRA